MKDWQMGQERGDVIRDAHGRMMRPIGIQRLLEWAFADEMASIDFEDEGTLLLGTLPGVGMEYVMMERAKLGCRVDGGGRNDPDHDADIVASAVAMLPEGAGGRAMAVRLAELARARMVPDAMVGVATSCEPRQWKRHKHGLYAKTEALEERTVVYRGVKRRVQVSHCPVIYEPSADKIGRMRRGYLQWWRALMVLRQTFQIYGGLSRWSVTDAMPPREPWKKGY